MAGSASSTSLLQVHDLRKRFGAQEVLRGASLDVPKGSLVTVLGRSGAGKSVLLKCLANIIQPDAGSITFDGTPLTGRDDAARADFRRRCSFLFQGNALFDSLTALENVSLPLEQTTRLPASEVRTRSLEALRLLDLEAFAMRHPSEMSGGMQKRLALARAIVTRPELVLFDEPTAGLDPVRRNAVFAMIATYQRQFGFTALVVTHDVQEALVASDVVALLEGGRVVFQGSPADFRNSELETLTEFRDSVDSLAETLALIRSGGHIKGEDT